MKSLICLLWRGRRGWENKKKNNIESYTKKNLDNIAKLLNILIFYKDGTKRISYKKEELYLKIKENIKWEN